MANDMQTAFDAVVRHWGSQIALARALGVTPQAVSYYKANGFAAEAAIQIERLSGGTFRAVDLVAEPEQRAAA